MRRNWIKIYVDQTLRGSSFSELLPDERFVWFGFLLLAGDNALEGKICITGKMGYMNQQLAELLKCDPELIDRSIKKMVKFKKIKVLKNNVIRIVNWEKFQSEYQRQKKYRNQKLQPKVTTKSDNEKCGVDRDRDRDRDKDKKRDKEKENPKTKKKKGLSKEEKKNYAQGMYLEKKWKGKKEKPDIKKENFNYDDKKLNTEAKKCYLEIGNICNVVSDGSLKFELYNKCKICLKNRANYR